MVTLTKKPFRFNQTICFCLLICTFLCSNVYCTTTEKATYHEIKKEGRIYVFTLPNRMDDFMKSGEVGKGIIKIGHGPNGETVVFGSEEAMFEYESRQVKQILDRLNIDAYQEFEKDSRIYVFTSPERRVKFKITGEMGKDFIAKIGYSSNGKTVMFDSHDAIKEYDSRHEVKTGGGSEINNYYREIEKDGRVYVFTSSERLIGFEKSGESGKGIIKIGTDQKAKPLSFILMKR